MEPSRFILNKTYNEQKENYNVVKLSKVKNNKQLKIPSNCSLSWWEKFSF